MHIQRYIEQERHMAKFQRTQQPALKNSRGDLKKNVRSDKDRNMCDIRMGCLVILSTYDCSVTKHLLTFVVFLCSCTYNVPATSGMMPWGVNIQSFIYVIFFESFGYILCFLCDILFWVIVSVFLNATLVEKTLLHCPRSGVYSRHWPNLIWVWFRRTWCTLDVNMAFVTTSGSTTCKKKITVSSL